MTESNPLKLFLRYPGASRSSRRIVEGQGELENSDLLQLLARVDFGESPTLEVLDVIASTLNFLRAGGVPEAAAEAGSSDEI